MPPPDDSPEDDAVVRAAALDDLLGGFAVPDHGAAPADAIDGDADGLLDTLLLLRQMAAADGAVPPAVAAPAPRSIGRHAILRLAGEGGFATVWEGFDTLLRRPVAVKVRRPEALLSETARRRFVREAEIAARLVHPQIVTIFEVGTDAGSEFIAAEFCSGGSLATWLDRHPGPLPPRVAARLVRALTGAVAYAHEAGIVHRDIKPANVLLAPAPAGTEPILGGTAAAAPERRGLTVKLGDFGLGKLQADLEGGDPLTQLTRTGASIGTPAWMAPEQIDGSFGAVGPATDVHALGLLLDRLLTGRSLRRGGTTAETYRQVLIDDVVPADRAVRGVPADLAAVCLKCLAKKPTDRYSSASALAVDLDRWLDGLPTVARPVAPAVRAVRWVARRPAVAGLAAAAVAASLVAVWAGIARVDDARQAAVREAEIRRQRGVAELRRGFEALRAGNVAGALAHLETTRTLDPALAESLAGRWLVRRAHGERAIVMEPDATAPANRPRDLYKIALAPDGATAAVAAADGTVRLLRGLDATLAIHSVAAHDEVNDVAFSADGQRLVTAGQDGRLRWWDVTAAGLVADGETDPGAGPLYAAAFAPDGSAIACGGADRVVRLVRRDDPDRAVELFRFAEPPGKAPDVESLVFTVDGTIAASCGDVVVVIDAATGDLVRELDRPAADDRRAVLGSLTVSPAGDRLLACGTDAKAHVWDLPTGRIVTSLPLHPAWVQGCCFVGAGDRVATACRDGGIRVFDAASGAALTRLAGHAGRVWAITCEPAGTLLSCGADGTVRRWDPTADFETAALRMIPFAGGEIFRIVELPDGSAGRAPRDLITLDIRGGLRRVDIASGASRLLPPVDRGAGFNLDVEPAGRRLILSLLDGPHLLLLDLVAAAGRDPVRWQPVTLPAAVSPSRAAPCWLPDGGLVASGWDGGLCRLSADLSRATMMNANLEAPVHDLVEAPSGPPRVAAIGKVTAIIPLPVNAASATAPLLLPVGEQTTAVGWSPDGAVVACGTDTGRVLIFDAATGAARGQLAPQGRGVLGVAYSADGRTIVTANRDGVRICDAATLSTLDEIRPDWHIRTMRLVADESRLVLGGCSGVEPNANDARLAVLEFEHP